MPAAPSVRGLGYCVRSASSEDRHSGHSWEWIEVEQHNIWFGPGQSNIDLLQGINWKEAVAVCFWRPALLLAAGQAPERPRVPAARR